MPIVSYGLTTVARFKSFIKKTTIEDDTLIETIINIVSDIVEKYCDRRFLETAYVDEYYDGNGSDQLLLKQYPVDTDETFVLEERDTDTNQNSWSAIQTQLYHVDPLAGMIELIGNRFAEVARKYRVDYTAGYAFKNDAAVLVPLVDVGLGGLELAVWKIVNNIYQDKNAVTNIKSESIGNYSVSYGDESIMTSNIKLILNQFKRPHLM